MKKLSLRNVTTGGFGSATLNSYNTYLTAAYKFNNGALVTDSKGSNTLINNNTVVGDASGKSGYCANLEKDSSQSFTITNPSADFKPSSKLAISCWVKWESLPGEGEEQTVCFGQFTNSGDGSPALCMIALYTSSGVQKFDILTYNNDGSSVTMTPAAVTINTGVYYHLVYILDGTNMRFFINNVQYSVDKSYSVIRPPDSEFAIGKINYYGSRYYLDGMIDEFYFWKDPPLTAVNAAEFVSELYNSGAGRFYEGVIISKKELALRSVSSNGGNIMPDMTGDTTEGVTVTADTSYGEGYRAWNAFDRNANTFWNAEGALPHWLKIDFGTARVVNQYTMQGRISGAGTSQHPTAWTIQGSNTGAFGGEQVTLDSQSSIVWTSDAEIKTFSFSNSTSYQYYKVNITTAPGTTISVAEMTFSTNTSAKQVSRREV